MPPSSCFIVLIKRIRQTTTSLFAAFTKGTESYVLWNFWTPCFRWRQEDLSLRGKTFWELNSVLLSTIWKMLNFHSFKTVGSTYTKDYRQHLRQQRFPPGICEIDAGREFVFFIERNLNSEMICNFPVIIHDQLQDKNIWNPWNLTNQGYLFVYQGQKQVFFFLN